MLLLSVDHNGRSVIFACCRWLGLTSFFQMKTLNMKRDKYALKLMYFACMLIPMYGGSFS